MVENLEEQHTNKGIQLTVKDEFGGQIANASGEIKGPAFDIDTLWVNPSNRRDGIGTRLLDRMLYFGRNAGAIRITGEAVPGPGSTKEEIIKFYEKKDIQVNNEGNLSGKL